MMNLALWIIAGLLAVVFLVGGAAKLFVPKARLAALPGGGWVEGFSAGAVKALGVLDVVAAAGLILPAALDTAPVLVPLAAVGVLLLMIGAIVTRVQSHLTGTIVPDLAYLALAGFVAWGRFGPGSFTG
jgi:DoxX-like family